MGDMAFWKTAHIVSAAILFGTGVGIAFFCWFGCRRSLRRGELASLRTILGLTVVADACLTAPAVVFQAVSGVILMNGLGWPLISPWSITVWSLFVFVGVCWLPVVMIQIMLRRESESVLSINALSAGFRRKLTYWFSLGVPAFAAVLGIFYLMVAKPLSVAG